MATVTVHEDESTPIEFNDAALSALVKATLAKTLDAKNVAEHSLRRPSEDVGEFSRGNKLPPYGASPGDPDVVAAAAKGGAPVPNARTSTCQPDPTPTIATGVTAMTAMTAMAMSLWQ